MSFPELVTAVDRAVQGHLGAVAVVYEPYLAPAVEVQGLFDANYVLVEGGAVGVESTGPAVWLRLEDLPSDPREDENVKVTIGGTRYTVRERKADGMGGILLVLLRAPGCP